MSGTSVACGPVSAARKGRLRRLRKALVLLECPLWRKAARKGVAAAVEHRAVPFGKSFATIIDVGAHYGQFALLAREMYSEAEIVCVEPLPNALDRLRAVHAQDARTRILPFAASDRNGPQSMYVSRKTDSSSLRHILQPYVTAFPGTEEAGTIEVETRTLDDLVDRAVAHPVMLKIDVQGGELEVLAGAVRTLAEVDVAYIECSFVEFYLGQALADDVIGALRSHGLRLDGVYSVVRDGCGRCLQADLLFRRGG